MLDKLKNALKNGDKKSDFSVQQLAAASLLVEAAHIDSDFSEAERSAIIEIVRERFSLSQEQVEALVLEAEKSVDKAVDYYRFAREIKENYKHEQTLELLTLIWEVILTDGRVDALESNLMRRLCGLLYMTDKENAAARKQAEANIKQKKNKAKVEASEKK